MPGGKKSDRMSPVEKYNVAYRDEKYAGPGASFGLQLVPWVVENIKFHDVLDVGCGSGFSVLRFLELGKRATGTESCRFLLDGRLQSMRELGMVKEATLPILPYPESSVDLVFCTEVLEHIPESDVHGSIGELLRVSKGKVFASVCFEEAHCFPELGLHETVRPKAWWEGEFLRWKAKFEDVTEEVTNGQGRETGAFYILRKG